MRVQMTLMRACDGCRTRRFFSPLRVREEERDDAAIACRRVRASAMRSHCQFLDARL